MGKRHEHHFERSTTEGFDSGVQICFAESTRKDVKMSQPASANPSAPPGKVKPRSHAFLLLAVLTGSVLVFWSPSVFYFSIQPFNGMSHPTFEKASLVLFNAQSVVDPLVFALTLKPLRTALISTFCCYK